MFYSGTVALFGKKKKSWDLEVDVLVVGTGGAGMTAAIAAHDAGAKVAVIEKTDKVGGTTAVSGGVLWVPQNGHMGEVGVADSRAEALEYTLRLADGRSNEALLARFIDTAPEMVKYLEAKTPLRFSSIQRYPDYHPEFAGGKPGGRSLDPGLFDTNELGAWKSKLRKSPVFGMTAMSVTEATDWGVFSNPKALLDRGIEPRLNTPASALIVEDARVIGLRAGDLAIKARQGVVLASGGFEWNAELCAHFLGGTLTHPNSPPANTGDGLKMAMSVGADLGNMSEAWWCPSVVIPGEEYDGIQLNRGDFAIRSLPHSIIVNRAGARFVNEAHNYNDMMKPFFTFDPVSYERPNLPCWLVLDQSFRDKYALLTVIPGMDTPKWIPVADTLEELAQKVGIDPAGLAASVKRFNQFALDGVDPDFRRGESTYDHFYGDLEHKPNPNLGVIDNAPFYALELHPGSIGTKGGPRVDESAQVLRVDGTPVPGLYAAGNVMAGVTGPGYPGAGSTIGTGMTFGFIAGRHAAAQKRI